MRYGGHLAKVDTHEINARVRAELVWGVASFWVGASEIGHAEGQYHWTFDDTVVATDNSSFTNWFTGEPNNAKGVDEECMMVGYSSSTNQEAFQRGITDNHWYDVPCCIPMPYVCEIPINANIPVYLQNEVIDARATCSYMGAAWFTCPYDYDADADAAVAFIVYMTFIGAAIIAGSVTCCWFMKPRVSIQAPGPTVNKMMGP